MQCNVEVVGTCDVQYSIEVVAHVLSYKNIWCLSASDQKFPVLNGTGVKRPSGSLKS